MSEIIQDILPSEKKGLTLSDSGHSCEIISWCKPNCEIGGKIVYVPGIPGTTLEEFGDEASGWTSGDKGWEIWGVIHSGVIRGDKIVNGKTMAASGGKIEETGVTADDWVRDIKTAIIQAQADALPLILVGHSFGGLIALTALAELVEEGKIDATFSSQIRFITVSSPTYQTESLPDRKPLRGSDPSQPHTFYEDSGSSEAVSETDKRVPMASMYAIAHMRDYLTDSKTIKVNQVKFTASMMQLVEKLGEKAAILGKTDIQVATLFPFQDRWVSRLAGDDLQKMMGKSIINMAFDLPASYYPHFNKTNAHDLVKVWAPYIYKSL